MKYSLRMSMIAKCRPVSCTLAAAALMLAIFPAAYGQEVAPEPAVDASLSGNANDPYEGFNRGVYAFNNVADKALFRPLAEIYQALLPAIVRQGVGNLFNNLQEPFTAINAVLQGKPDVAGNALGRFVINSTVGVAGLSDQAKTFGMERQEEDLGQTLAVWGVGGEPFLMMPFLGPSNPRDAVTGILEFLFEPLDLYIDNELGQTYAYSSLGVRIIDARAGALGTVDKMLETSVDPYVALREAYRQQRQFQINDGKTLFVVPQENFDEYDAEPETPAAP